jgi:hypothetical protein
MRLAILIVSNLGSGFSLLRQLLSDADSLTVKQKDGSLKFEFNWRGLVAYECLQVAISSPYLSHLFSTASISIGAPIIIQILESYVKVTKAIESSPESAKVIYSGPRTKVILSNIESEIPIPTLSQIERIVIESLATFAENLQNGFMNTKSKPSRKADETIDDELRCKQTLTLSWQMILTISERLIQLGTDDQNLNLLLKTYVSMIAACGSGQVVEGRDAFLTSLCRESITSTTMKDVQPKDKP